eukprot:2628130-Amphidinium_carterae.1
MQHPVHPSFSLRPKACAPSVCKIMLAPRGTCFSTTSIDSSRTGDVVEHGRSLLSPLCSSWGSGGRGPWNRGVHGSKVRLISFKLQLLSKRGVLEKHCSLLAMDVPGSSKPDLQLLNVLTDALNLP